MLTTSTTRDEAGAGNEAENRARLDPACALSPEGEGDRLLAAVADIAEILARHAERSDTDGRLAPPTVKALRAHGLWRMRLCRELGGLELPIATQIRVLAALAAADTSSAWCTMIANSSVAVLGATMPSAAIDRVFADGVPACTIVAAPSGKAIPTEGGYTLTGTWRMASSIRHADWIHATTYVEGDPSRPLPVALPAHDVELLDSWNVVGLGGTGSQDFWLHEYFVPCELAGDEGIVRGQQRGTRRYDQVDLENLESYEHLAFALGVARRALAELQQLFAGGAAGRFTADREVVQVQLGRATVRLQAVEATAVEVYDRVDAAAAGQELAWTSADRHLPRALAAWATETALECVQLAFQRAGAAALQRPNILEKLLRDMNVAATHVMVGDNAFSSHSHHLVEFSDLEDRRGARRHAD